MQLVLWCAKVCRVVVGADFCFCLCYQGCCGLTLAQSLMQCKQQCMPPSAADLGPLLPLQACASLSPPALFRGHSCLSSTDVRAARFSHKLRGAMSHT